MQDGGGVLELAILTHRRRLAVALRLRTGNPERRERAFAQQLAELLADIDQRAEILDISPRERIFDHRDSRRPAHRRIDRPAHLAACFLDDGHDFSHLALHRGPTWIPQRCLSLSSPAEAGDPVTTGLCERHGLRSIRLAY